MKNGLKIWSKIAINEGEDMKKLLFFCFLLQVFFINSAIISASTSEIVLFSKNNTQTRIDWAKCNKSESRQFVEVDDEEKIIFWRWRSKLSGWCGWGLRLPQSNLVNYYDTHSLKITWKLSSQYDKKFPPEVKFVSYQDRSSSLVKIGNAYYVPKKNTSLKIFMINLKDFYGRSKSMKNLKYLQFDAPYESISGKIEIVDIRIVKRTIK